MGLRAIVQTPGIAGGLPRIACTRYPVSVVAQVFREGASVAELAQRCDVKIEWIEEALRFALMGRSEQEHYLAGHAIPVWRMPRGRRVVHG